MIFESQTVAEYLNRELERRLGTNPRYSMRAFAKSLGLSPGELSEVLRSKRPLSNKSCMKIARALELSPAEYRQLLVLSASSAAGNTEGAQAAPVKPEWRDPQRLDEDRFRLISDWWCFAILSLIDTEGFRWNNADISSHFGITRMQAQSAMERLLRLGLVRVSTVPGLTGQYQAVATNDFVEHLSQIPSEAIRRYHRSLLEKAMAALELQDQTERDITGVGFAVDPKDVKAIKSEIAEFQDQIVAKYGRKRRGRILQAVYQLEMALFRLTEGKAKS